MTEKELSDLLSFSKGTYRLLKDEVVPLLRRIAPPSQGDLPGIDLPAPASREAPPPPPRRWGNSVRVYDALHARYGAGAFTLADLLTDAGALAAVREATGGRVAPASLSAVLSALVRAGAASRERRTYRLRAPTDAIREAIETARSKRLPPAS